MNKLIVFPLFFFLLFSISAYAATNYTSTYILDDSDVYNGTYLGTYDGNSSSLALQSYPTYNSRIYMMWNTSMIPYGATITDANVYLYLYSQNSGYAKAVYVYNTSLNWTEDNITWNVVPTLGSLISNNTLEGSTFQYKKFNVTKAFQYARDNNISMSIMLRFEDEASRSFGRIFYSKEHGTNEPMLEVSYSIPNCNFDCGDCGCAADSFECYVPPIIGSYCDNEEGLPNTIKTVYNSSCTGTKREACPLGTVCNQISPLANMSVFPTTPGEATLPYCHQCVFMNMKVASYPLAPTFKWVTVWTNCPNNPECNCLGWLCSNNLYEAPLITDVPYNVTAYNAGCFNPTSGYWVNVTNSTGGQTTIDQIVNDSCGSACTIGNNTPQTECPLNTTSACYDAGCNPVKCTQIIATTCEKNYGGQLALATASIFGISDCGQAQNITALIISLIASVVIVFLLAIYGNVSDGLVNMFLGSNLLMLVLFTLIGWFPAWLIVILIVVSALGISGLLSKLLGAG